MILFILKLLLVSICGAYIIVAFCPLIPVSEQRNPFFYAKNADDFGLFFVIVIANIAGICLLAILMTYGSPEVIYFNKNTALIYGIGANLLIPSLKLLFIMLEHIIIFGQNILFKIFRKK